MLSLDYALCPRCYKEARTKKKVVELFGLRNMGNGIIRVQSHCRTCRVEEKQEARLRSKRRSK